MVLVLILPRVMRLFGYGVCHMCGEKACSALMVEGVVGGETGKSEVDWLFHVGGNDDKGCPKTISWCVVVWVSLARTHDGLGDESLSVVLVV